MAGLANEIAEVETAAWQVLEARTLANADTERLDVLGRLLGQPRFSSDDEVYRGVLRGKIAANRSHGREDDIRTVVRLAAQTTLPATVTHLAPATVVVAANEHLASAAMAALAFLLPRVRAAGVRLNFINPPPTTDGLTFASSVSGGGGDFASSVSGGGDNTFSARIL